uniref:Uncharacterized protein n=2 Tax=Clytia hemisphaerica TaxID=252671 RepID=A0A7M5WLU4_9CNID
MSAHSTSTSKADQLASTKSSKSMDSNHHSNLIITSSLTLLLLATHASMDSVVGNPASVEYIPRWAALLGILIGVFLIKSCIISYLGYKSSFILCALGFVLSLLFHFDPQIVPLTCSGLIEGVCWLILSVTISSYVTQLAHEYSDKNETTKHHATSKYLAVPYFFYKMAELGVQIFEKSLHKSDDFYTAEGINKTYSNSTFSLSPPVPSVYHPQHNCSLHLTINDQYTQHYDIFNNQTDDFSLHFKLLTNTYTINNTIIGATGGACSLAIAGIYHFLENKDNAYHHEARTRSLRYNLISSLYLLKNKTLLFMLPITVYLGMSRAYIYTRGLDYTIYCKDTSLTYVLTIYFAVCCISSIVYHYLADNRQMHSVYWLYGCMTVHVILLAMMLLKVEHPSFFPFIVVTLLGLSDVVLYCYIKGIFGTLYESKVEALYTVFEFAQKIGIYLFHIVMVYSNGYVQIIMLLVVQVISIAAFTYSTKLRNRRGTLHRFDIPYFL